GRDNRGEAARYDAVDQEEPAGRPVQELVAGHAVIPIGRHTMSENRPTHLTFQPAAHSGYPHPIIAREGWLFIIIGAAAAGKTHWAFGPGWAMPLWLLVVFMVQFSRDPPRQVPEDPKAVLSPADGRIVAVERSRDPYLERDAVKMSVFMNVFNVHSNRSPVDGEVRDAWYHLGKFFNAALSKSSLANARAPPSLSPPPAPAPP